MYILAHIWLAGGGGAASPRTPLLPGRLRPPDPLHSGGLRPPDLQKALRALCCCCGSLFLTKPLVRGSCAARGRTFFRMGRPMGIPMKRPIRHPMRLPMGIRMGRPMGRPMRRPVGRPVGRPRGKMDNRVAPEEPHQRIGPVGQDCFTKTTKFLDSSSSTSQSKSCGHHGKPRKRHGNNGKARKSTENPGTTKRLSMSGK